MFVAKLFGFQVVFGVICGLVLGGTSSLAFEKPRDKGRLAAISGLDRSLVTDEAFSDQYGAVSESARMWAQAGSKESSPEKGPEVPEPPKESPVAQPDEVQSLKEHIIDLQNKGKLGFRKVLLCSSVEGYGQYSPVTEGGPTRQLALYFEPANVSTLVSADRYVIDCTVDQFAYDASGKMIFGKSNIMKIYRVSRSPVLDLYFHIGVGMKKPVQGTLILKTVLRDNIKNQTATAVNRVNIQSGPKKPEGSI